MSAQEASKYLTWVLEDVGMLTSKGSMLPVAPKTYGLHRLLIERVSGQMEWIHSNWWEKNSGMWGCDNWRVRILADYPQQALSGVLL